MGFLGGIIKAILPSLEGEALKALFGFIGNLLEQRNLIAQGATQQALAETVIAARTEAAMNKAAADSPVSKDAVLDALGSGKA